VNLDWLFTYPSDKFAPYWNIGLGYFTLEDSGEAIAGGEDLSSVSFNYGLGAFYSITDNFEFDMSLRGKVMKWQGLESSSYTIETSSSIVAFYVGVNFKF
jgi:opacity protein-like surface antigen